MSSAREVLDGLTFSKEPSGQVEPDGSDAFCFRNELWRLKGWAYEEGPEWDRFPDWIDPDDCKAVVQRAALTEIWLDEAGAFERLSRESHPGMALFRLVQRADGAKGDHVAYASSVPLIGRFWDATGRWGGGPCWPLHTPAYLQRFDVRIVAVLVDENQEPHQPNQYPRYSPGQR
ncbi:hypothetical protein ACIGXM_28595 [Kitasatospora sp. NPDC052896]|uniref:hypothetical protein n=1 Tax=Kitasatospora sp. NPDC052896 TaxID=3364061 RepID=UPI0037C8F337